MNLFWWGEWKLWIETLKINLLHVKNRWWWSKWCENYNWNDSEFKIMEIFVQMYGMDDNFYDMMWEWFLMFNFS